MSKPILCVDFDGVINSYNSGWVEADFIPDPPVPGAMRFLADALDYFTVKIFSSRAVGNDAGVRAMATYIRYWSRRCDDLTEEEANAIANRICFDKDAFPKEKPPATVTLDDRAITFTGVFPTMDELRGFKPWNKGGPVKREPAAWAYQYLEGDLWTDYVTFTRPVDSVRLRNVKPLYAL
jgi:hypothetical protein